MGRLQSNGPQYSNRFRAIQAPSRLPRGDPDGILAVAGDMGKQRERFEGRFGRLGAGARTLRINEVPFSLTELMERLGLANQECRSIDALAVAGNRFVLRYLDSGDQCIVAYEFDPAFRYLGETRVHVAEWIGEGNPWTSS